MRHHFKNLNGMFCAITGLVIVTTSATTVVPPTFEEMTDRADFIFAGTVASSRAEWRSTAGNRAIFTLVNLEAQEVLKGKETRAVTLQFLGGTIGDETLEVTGVPRFSAGERVILFVEKNGVQFCPLVGVFHGKFRLNKDEKTGRDMVLMHNGKPLRDLSDIGSGEGAEFALNQSKISSPTNQSPMSAESFKAKIRDQLRKTGAQK